jgi:deoxycytidylate deaminase
MSRPEPPKHIVRLAIETSRESPCQSKRGVVIFDATDDHRLPLSRAYNFKPAWFPCDGSNACKATCHEQAVHAEQDALLQLGPKARGAEMLHVKTVNGRMVPSGGPSCVQCSKLAVVAGITAVWLYHDDGWRRYDMREFHRLSLQAARPPASLPALEAPQQSEGWCDDDDGRLDDIVVPNVATFRMERMDRNKWWIGLYRVDGSMVHVDLALTKHGVIATKREDCALAVPPEAPPP